MSAFIENPRRSPRDRLRCVARVATVGGGLWLTFTRDLGPQGCQLAVPGPVDPGTRIAIELLDGRAGPGPVLAVAGEVVWCAATAPWRVGVAFDVASVPAASRFFEGFAAGRPRLCAAVNAPERLPAAALLAPSPPPAAQTPALTYQEARVLRTLGAGRSAGALVEELGGEAALHALFALLARRYVAIGSPDRGAAERWVPVLDRLSAREPPPPAALDRPEPRSVVSTVSR